MLVNLFWGKALFQKKKNRINRFFLKLPDLDSNQDKQNQNLSYYHYTIGQYPLLWDCKNKRS
jgi:hypothetical protein